MMEGTILNYRNNNGQIKGDDDRIYAFNRRAIQQGNVDDAIPGRRVRFQLDDDRARDVILLGDVLKIAKPEPPSDAPGPTLAAQPTTIARSAPSGPYRFLNPYNFVRPLEIRNPNASPLLGRCAPPPHDRYVGFNGRITCRLTAATPIFISDSHGIETETTSDGKEHRHYRFFCDPEGNVVIPGTSLRGVFRSTFEAVTNSCFSNFAADKRLSYHLPPNDALRLVPARVRKVNSDHWELDLLPGTTPVSPNQRPAGPQYAAWVHTYRPLWASQTNAKAPSTPYARRVKLSLAGWNHGETCQAIVEPVSHPLRQFEFWNVVELAKPGDTLPKPVGKQRQVTGYLCITNQNIENKHDERLFFSTNPSKPMELPKPVRDRYCELIADYQERHAADADKRQRQHKSTELPAGKDPAFSWFVVHRLRKSDEKLRDGDLVYAMLTQKGFGFTVDYVVPVSVPRVGFKSTIGELLHPDDLVHCEDCNSLCPACRTFGWVWGTDDSEKPRPDLDKPTAYGSRVRFSLAQRVHDAGTFDATLAILSTPKPTTTRFYLAPKTGKPQDGLDDDKSRYDDSVQTLRGRKVYRHHGGQLSAQEYQSVNGAKSDQNRTVHGVQKAGSMFEFSVDFENLAETELGALIWSLEMEGWHHRIGFGKPLGFGSVRTEITSLKMIDQQARYGTLLGDEGSSERMADKDKWVRAFKQAMAERFGADFDKLPNVRDLRALLASTPSRPVHYPRSARKPQPEGKNYEWFVGNKRSGRNAGPRLVLRLADEDTQGLPLLDRFGEELP